MGQKIIEEIYSIYVNIKERIKKRVEEFKNIWNNGTNKDLFLEMAFCLFTPQSKALSADKALKNIINKGLLYSNDERVISNELNIVRFKNNKAKYFIIARDKYLNQSIREIINPENIFETREYLVKNVIGYGYKEASHFLRNIGFVEDIAILDRHILKNLVLLNVIKEIPHTINGKIYKDIETKFKEFSFKINIPFSHLDFILWYKETKEIFK